MTDKPRILIVEDDALTALFLQNLVTDMGCEVCGLASTGPRAVALADYHRPDLALVDVRLAKGTDGLAAARQMRQELKLNVVIVSGWLGELEGDDVIRDLPSIRKPFSAEQVQAVLQRALDLPEEEPVRPVARLRGGGRLRGVPSRGPSMPALVAP
ncbi:MAG TPA: response regulator [Azospirillaceae bacterium]|nr:response regulator [Azospirillaceae bacterium]